MVGVFFCLLPVAVIRHASVCGGQRGRALSIAAL